MAPSERGQDVIPQNRTKGWFLSWREWKINRRQEWPHLPLKLLWGQLTDRNFRDGGECGMLQVQRRIVLGQSLVSFNNHLLSSSVCDLTSLWQLGKSFGKHKHSLIPSIPKTKNALSQHLRPVAEILPRYCALPTWWPHTCIWNVPSCALCSVAIKTSWDGFHTKTQNWGWPTSVLLSGGYSYLASE